MIESFRMPHFDRKTTVFIQMTGQYKDCLIQYR